VKAWPLLVYGVGALLDAASTYAALLLVPGAFETNPRVAPLLFTPLHPLSELAAFAVMASLYLAGLLADDGAVVRVTQRGEETVAQLLGSLYCPALAHSTWLRGLAPTVLSIPLRAAGER